MFHGDGDNVATAYSNLASKLSTFGFTSLDFDHAGFGKSEGKRGLIPSWEYRLEQSISFVNNALKHEYDNGLDLNTSVYLLGCSCGAITVGGLAIEKSQLKKANGVILVSPLLNKQSAIFGSKNLSYLIDLVKFGFLKKSKSIKNSRSITKLPKILKKDKEHINQTTKFTTSVTYIMALKFIFSNLKNFSIPCLIVHDILYDKNLFPTLLKGLVSWMDGHK